MLTCWPHGDVMMTSSMEAHLLPAHRCSDWGRTGMCGRALCARVDAGDPGEAALGPNGRRNCSGDAVPRRRRWFNAATKNQSKGRRRRAWGGVPALQECREEVGGARRGRRRPGLSLPAADSCGRARGNSSSPWLPCRHGSAETKRGAGRSFGADRRSSAQPGAAAIAGGLRG